MQPTIFEKNPPAQAVIDQSLAGTKLACYWIEDIEQSAARYQALPGALQADDVVVGRGGPNLIRGMGVMRDTLEVLGLPYRMFGFDSDMSAVINYAKAADAWMKAGGRAAVAKALKIAQPEAA